MQTVVVVVDAIVLQASHRTRQRSPPRQVIELRVVGAWWQVADFEHAVHIRHRLAQQLIIHATGTLIGTGGEHLHRHTVNPRFRELALPVVVLIVPDQVANAETGEQTKVDRQIGVVAGVAIIHRLRLRGQLHDWAEERRVAAAGLRGVVVIVHAVVRRNDAAAAERES